MIVSYLAHEEGELLVCPQATADSRCVGEFKRRLNNLGLRELGKPPDGQVTQKCNDCAS